MAHSLLLCPYPLILCLINVSVNQQLCLSWLFQLKVLAIIGLRPQLRVIRRVITDAALSLCQDHPPPSTDLPLPNDVPIPDPISPLIIPGKKSDHNAMQNDLKDPHNYPSNYPMTSPFNHNHPINPSVENQNLQVIQFLSASCRAARSKPLYFQPAAAVLRHITDHDAEECREKRMVMVGSATMVGCTLFNNSIISTTII